MMKKSIALILALVLALMPLMLTGCSLADLGGFFGNDGKQIPVYQGMSISEIVLPTLATDPELESENVLYMAPNNGNNGNGNGNNGDDGNNGNHYGQHKGDSTDKDEDINEEDPFPDQNENIEEEIGSSLEVVGAVNPIYYTEPNRDIYIHVHIKNPDNYEILSFTLNSKKYSSYMFEEGSDMETIILKLNVGEAEGIVEYTIDAIKYVDGTEIKDVLIDGNKTVKAGIRTENQMEAVIKDFDIDTNAVSFTVDFSDRNSLIALSGGMIKAGLYDGKKIVAMADVVPGENQVTFDGLETNKLYQFGVVGYFDDLSGSGMGIHLLCEKAFYTEAVMLFDDVKVGSAEIEFSIFRHEDHLDAPLISLSLFQGEELLAELDPGATRVDGLLADTEYLLVAKYEVGDSVESISLEFTTAKRVLPGVTIVNPVSTQTSVGFTIEETDPSDIGEITRIDLYRNGAIVQTTDDFNVRSFEGLLSGKTYTVKITYAYDLNDGLGEQTVTRTLTTSTSTYKMPTISISGPEMVGESIDFEIEVVDDDGVGEIAKIELFKDGVFVKRTDDITARSFDGLLSGKNYAIRVTYACDMHDGLEKRKLTKEHFFTTAEKTIPTVDIVDLVKTKTSVAFDVEAVDPDEISAITKIELIHANGTIEAADPSVREFTGLLSNNTYIVKVTYMYDLNDGTGEHTGVVERSVTTDAKAIPEIGIINPTKTQTSIGFEINETDLDTIGAVTKIELIHANGTIEATDPSVREFTGLLSNNTYTVKVTYEYDLNDGEGVQEGVTEVVIVTEAKTAPKVTITNPNPTKTSIAFGVKAVDPDGISVIKKIELIHANGTIEAADPSVREFTGLLSNNTYTVKVTYEYDLNDGEGVQEGVTEVVIVTRQKVVPRVTIPNSNPTKTSIAFDVKAVDPDGISVIKKIELIHANGTIEVADPSVREFTGLLSNNTYTVKVTYEYDLNDGEGVHTVVVGRAIRTNEKVAPTFSVDGAVITTNSIAANYNITDQDDILANYTVELYCGETLVGENEKKEIAFNGLSYYTEYTLKITYIYDLNDGQGVQTSVFEKVYKTLPFIEATACNIVNSSAVSNGETIFMEIALNNPCSMMVTTVVINGEAYAVATSTAKKAFVEIVCGDQFTGGDTFLKVDELTATIDGVTVTVRPEAELSDNVFINGFLGVKSYQLVDENMVPYERGINIISQSEDVYVLITLDNPSGYVIDSIKGCTKIDQDRYLYRYNGYRRMYYVYIPEEYDNIEVYYGWNEDPFVPSLELRYHNEYVSKTTTITGEGFEAYRFFKTRTDEVKYVSTPKDLKNMKDGYYYELTNDIDLDGLEWIGGEFYGVFDGKGYSVKNMTFVGKTTSSNEYLGLFSKGSGILRNLAIENATIVTDSGTYCGGFLGYVEGSYGPLYMENCMVDENSTLSINNKSGCIGGFIGYDVSRYPTIIVNCINKGAVNGHAAAGFVGHTYNDELSIVDSCNYGALTNNGQVVHKLVGDPWGNNPEGKYLVNSYDLTAIEDYDGKEHTYTFMTNGGEPIDAITSTIPIIFPTPVREGYIFLGWYDNAALSGDAIEGSYYSTGNPVLYAKWKDMKGRNGSSFETAYTIGFGPTLPAVFYTPGQQIYYCFTAPHAGTYRFTVTGDHSGYGCLYGTDLKKIKDGKGEAGFEISQYLAANETVYFVLELSSDYQIGTLTVRAH